MELPIRQSVTLKEDVEIRRIIYCWHLQENSIAQLMILQKNLHNFYDARLKKEMIKICLKCLIEDEIKRLQRRNEKIEYLKPNQLRKNVIAIAKIIKGSQNLCHDNCPFTKKEAINAINSTDETVS